MSRATPNVGARNTGAIWGRSIQTRAAGRPAPEWYWDGNHWSYTGGQHGDGREKAASEFAWKQAPKGNPVALLEAIDAFHCMGRDHELIHVGPRKGAWLAAATRARKPLVVLEFGTQIGYSTILIAQLLPAGGHVWTIEPNPANTELATANIAHAGLQNAVKVLKGTFEDVWADIPCPLDLVFLDHSRAKYLQELLVLEKWGYVVEGTVVVADNIGGEGGSHGHAKAEEYARHVRHGDRYCSSFMWGDDDGIEVSECVARGGRAKVVTAEWQRRACCSPLTSGSDGMRTVPALSPKSGRFASAETSVQDNSSSSPNLAPSPLAEGHCRVGAATATAGRWRRTSKAHQITGTSVLSNGLEIPLLGVGTWDLRGASCEAAICTAIEQGYRLIDTASSYGNEADIGRALAVTQETPSILIQTKVGPRDMGYANARKVAEKSQKHLRHLDILLIHWPGRDRLQRYETWRALEDLYAEKKVRAIGVSNFLPEHIKGLLEDGAKIKPMLNQIEIHLLCQNKDVVDYCRKESIVVQSYSTLGGGPRQGKIRPEDGTATLLGHPVIKAVAAEVGQSPAVVCLRWAVQQGIAVIPKSSSPEHIAQNAAVLNIMLTEKQMQALTRIDEDHHFAWDPRETLACRAGVGLARRPKPGGQ